MTRQSSAATRPRQIALICALALGNPSLVLGQTTIDWATLDSGSWWTLANWSPKIIPNSPDHRAVLSGITPYDVTLAASATVGSLIIENSHASLTVSNAQLRLLPSTGETSVNKGVVRFATQVNLPPAVLYVAASSRIEGAGRFVRATASESILRIAPGVGLVNGFGHTIESPMLFDFESASSTLVNESVLSPGGITPGGPLRSLLALKPGHIELASSSNLFLELGPSQVCEQIGNIEGTVTLGGTLTVLLGPGATMNIGDDFPLVLGTLSGDFEAVNLPVPPFGRRWTTLRFENSYEIVIVCIADCDENFVLTIDDFICFQTLFSLGDLAADCDASQTLTIDDFICFQTAFVLGC